MQPCQLPDPPSTLLTNGRTCSAHPDADIFRLQEFLQALDATGATETTLFVAAIRTLRRDIAELVDPHRPRFELTGDPVRPAEIGGLHEGVQPIRSVVCDAHRLCLVAELHKRDDRSEGLLLG